MLKILTRNSIVKTIENLKKSDLVQLKILYDNATPVKERGEYGFTKNFLSDLISETDYRASCAESGLESPDGNWIEFVQSFKLTDYYYNAVLKAMCDAGYNTKLTNW